jgi:uncharacterized protein (DUF1330 family)
VSCYFIARIRIHNSEEYARYEAGFDEILARHSGEVVAVDKRPTVLEGVCRDSRVMVIRFPTDTEAKRWYESPEYQAIARHRFRASEANVILVNGRG